MGDYGRGYVYMRGDIAWIGFSAGGREVRESTGQSSKQVAKEILDKRRRELRTAPPGEHIPTFEIAAEAIKARYEMKNRRTDPEKRLKHLRPAFRGLDLRKVTTGRIESYARARVKLDGAANGTVNRELACLRRMMNIMRERGLMVATPKFPMLDESDAIRTGFVGEDELQAILTHIRPELHPVVEFGYITGWRKGEILSRDWQHVSDQSVRLEPGETKNRDGREFPLIPRLKAVIDHQRARMGDRVGGPLFFWKPGRRIKSMKDSWNNATEAAGLPDMLFHDMRRSAVRNLVLSGVDPHTAKALTGHKTDAVFERYDIIDSARLHEQTAKLEAFYGTQEPKVRAINGR